MEPPKSKEEAEFRVLDVCSKTWENKDGLRNMGNLAKKAGMPSSEFSRIHLDLVRQKRLYS